MKKALVVIAFVVFLISMSSCGAGKHNCPAYSSVEDTEESVNS